MVWAMILTNQLVINLIIKMEIQEIILVTMITQMVFIKIIII